MNSKIKRYLLIFSLAFLSGCGRTEAVVEDDASDKNVSAVSEHDEESETDGDNIKAATEEQYREEAVRVYVCGAVVNEGVYELSAGDIVDDALEMAGGYRNDAYRGYVNLAAPLTDGMRIYFPTEAEMTEAVLSDTDGGLSAGLASDDGAAVDNNSAKININTADKSELTKLPGIGESRAEDIIRYREENGKFKSINEIMNVNGIKEGVFDKIRDLITI
ncbi:MAG: helix-hairpin-helix domain-containing protein [Eubacterium sp.]|nr:helix-hairpin-helix domain-containing protein [Eubacterium sp.]